VYVYSCIYIDVAVFCCTELRIALTVDGVLERYVCESALFEGVASLRLVVFFRPLLEPALSLEAERG
jgi:hypothetical protein